METEHLCVRNPIHGIGGTRSACREWNGNSKGAFTKNHVIWPERRQACSPAYLYRPLPCWALTDRVSCDRPRNGGALPAKPAPLISSMLVPATSMSRVAAACAGHAVRKLPFNIFNMPCLLGFEALSAISPCQPCCA